MGIRVRIFFTLRRKSTPLFLIVISQFLKANETDLKSISPNTPQNYHWLFDKQDENELKHQQKVRKYS